ncbi:hypothetical protein E2C01_022094 [Portunus trituberculatus]|uniref:Uncharacterized protein n=1 Tax=Portunus trituberculatus TaxID=210409 RepID=A0A5B7E4B8_PORTR|nr:hypothetical protein [Portunus trituberculatus]
MVKDGNSRGVDVPLPPARAPRRGSVAVDSVAGRGGSGFCHRRLPWWRQSTGGSVVPSQRKNQLPDT